MKAVFSVADIVEVVRTDTVGRFRFDSNKFTDVGVSPLPTWY